MDLLTLIATAEAHPTRAVVYRSREYGTVIFECASCALEYIEASFNDDDRGILLGNSYLSVEGELETGHRCRICYRELSE